MSGEKPEISDEAMDAYRAAAKECCGFSTCACDESLRAGLAAAYPLLRHQWEAEMSECDEMIQLPIFFEGQPHPYVRCVRKPLGHPMPHRSEDGMEWSPVMEVDRG